MQNIVQGYRNTEVQYSIQEYRDTIYITEIQGYNSYNQARTQELSQRGGGKFSREARKNFFAPPLALKMLLFYIKSTTCPLGGPFSIQGQYITMYPSV